MTTIQRKDGRNNTPFFIFERKWDFSKGTGWHEEAMLNLPLHKRLKRHVVTSTLQKTSSKH